MQVHKLAKTAENKSIFDHVDAAFYSISCTEALFYFLKIYHMPYPYENLSSALHLVISDATNPASNAVQSKNMWNESEIKPRLKVTMFLYYNNFTHVQLSDGKTF